MDRKQTPDTPWHISFVKKDESDPRRHKARCFYYQQGECHCVKSAYYTSRCPGSSHCNKYTEDEVQTQDIRELQAERKRAEQYHEKMIKKRIELEQQLGEAELYTRYGKVLECPVCGGRLIKNKCNYCDSFVQNLQEQKRMFPINCFRNLSNKDMHLIKKGNPQRVNQVKAGLLYP